MPAYRHVPGGWTGYSAGTQLWGSGLMTGSNELRTSEGTKA